MPLSDLALRQALAQGQIKVEPFPKDADFQPCSIDLHLGTKLLVPRHGSRPIDLGEEYPEGLEHYYRDEELTSEGYQLYPGAFVLGATHEYVTLGAGHCAHFDGRSTLGRLGLMVHVTAGFCDPGFEGNITLEIKNLAPYSIVLAAGIGIGQLLVAAVDGPVARPYGSAATRNKYVEGNYGPVAPNLRRKL